MDANKFINAIIRKGLIPEDKIVDTLMESIKCETIEEYNSLISVCKRYGLDLDEYLDRVYYNSSQEIQYQIWKDGYGDNCPVNMLLDDISSENKDILDQIKHDYDFALPKCNAFFDGIQDIIIKHLSESQESIKIAMAWFTNPSIFNSLLSACKRGIDVELIINNDLINNRVNGLPFNKLLEAGADIYIAEYPRLIHNKFCVIDHTIVIDGSYNWTILAEKKNDENIVIIENAKVIDKFISAFDKLTSSCEYIEQMPDRIPEKPEYDCCSYKTYNSEEWLQQLPSISSKTKRYTLYKEIFKSSSEDFAREHIPEELFELIQEDIELEKDRDLKLFKSGVSRQDDKLQRKLNKTEHAIDKIRCDIERISQKRENEVKAYKAKITAIKSKKVSENQKEAQLKEVAKLHKANLTKIRRSLVTKNKEIENLSRDAEIISSQKHLVDSMQTADLKGSEGICRINLHWNTCDDLDLHLILPNGQIDSSKDVYYKNMSTEYIGAICRLDHDAIPENHGENSQENIIFENILPNGMYNVKVKLFNHKSGKNIIPFYITIFYKNRCWEHICQFIDADSNDVMDIASLVVKNGRLVTPISFR
jgi:hypothetical protein